MRYDNQRPDLAEQIKALLQSSNSVKTVPHGVKTVEPGEGLQLISATGTETFWDGDKAEQWSQAIADGTAAIADAAGRLGQAEQDITDAKDRIGQVAAGEIEKIDGHIIINGTVDLPALNVTGEMAATIVQSMSAETKRLIVTEDAILNRATVIESLITPELIAERVDTRYLRAQDISTANLEVLGRFRTAPMGQPQLIIQPSQSAWNSKDLGVWFSPDGQTPGFGSTDGWVAGMWMESQPDTKNPQPLNVRGQSGAGVVVWGDSMILRPVKGTVAYLESFGGQDFKVRSRRGSVELMSGTTMTLQAATDVKVGSGYNSDVRINSGTGVHFFDQSSASGYNQTASQAPNMYIHTSGKIYRSTSSRRYKKHISDYHFDISKLRDVRLRRWHDRKQAGQDEDPTWYYGAIAEEVYELYPEHVPMIQDPSWDGDGPAPMVPDSIAYDRLAMCAAVAGWQDADRRLAEAMTHIQSLETRVARLEGATA